MSSSTVSHTTMLSGGTLHGTELTLQLCWASPFWRTSVVRKFPVASHLLIVMDATTTRHRTAVLRHTVVSTCWSGNLSSMPRVIACIGSDALLNSIWVSGSGTMHLRPGTWDSESHAMSTTIIEFRGFQEVPRLLLVCTGCAERVREHQRRHRARQVCTRREFRRLQSCCKLENIASCNKLHLLGSCFRLLRQNLWKWQH